MPSTGTRVSIPPVQLEWLREQSARWHAEGLLGDGARAAILEGYEAETPQRRGLQALVAIGVVICAVGLLLLIGYNWSQLTPTMKVSMVLVAVSASFMASALSYRAVVGNLLWSGVLLLAAGGGLLLLARLWRARDPDGAAAPGCAA